jgi:hypothetical protein
MDYRTTEQVLGRWSTDPKDADSISEYGVVGLDFKADGSLVYTIYGDDREQRMFLTYRIEDGVLVTDQPSDPREDRTPFEVTRDGELRLRYGDRWSTYIRPSG